MDINTPCTKGPLVQGRTNELKFTSDQFLALLGCKRRCAHVSNTHVVGESWFFDYCVVVSNFMSFVDFNLGEYKLDHKLKLHDAR